MPNRYTGTNNDPFQEAQHNYLGPGWAQFFKSLEGKRVNLGPIGMKQSTGLLPRPGDEDSARSNAVNAYLGDLTDENVMRAQSLRDMEAHNRAVDTADRDRQAAGRALAIANDPNASAFGRPVELGPNGKYVAGSPGQPPVNRQALAAQMAPGVIAPPAPVPVTYGAPVKATVTVNGKPEQLFVRPGSDGQTYDMGRKLIDPAAIKQDIATSTANTEAKEAIIDEAAKNLLANPRDLTSLKSVASLQGDQRLKLYNAIKKANPEFNVGNIDRQIKFLDSYEDPKGRAATNRGSMNNILMHASDLSAANQEYRRANMRIVNTPIAVLQRQGGTEWQQFATPLAVLKDEIALYFAGGYAPTAEQGKTWDRIVNDTATPAQVEQFAKDIAHVGLRRADTHNQQFRTMMGYDDPNLITPEARAAAERIGMGDAVKKYKSGGIIGAKDAPPAGGTVEFIAPDGGILDVPAGEVAAFTKAHPTVKRKG